MTYVLLFCVHLKGNIEYNLSHVPLGHVLFFCVQLKGNIVFLQLR